MLFKHLFPILGLVSCTSLTSIAFGYDWETSLELSKNEDLENPGATASATYFFSPLNHSSATPWEETAFTDRIASFQLETGYEKQSYLFNSGPTLPGVNLDRKQKAIAATYTRQSVNSPHSISAFIGYNRLTADNVVSSWSGSGPNGGFYSPSDFNYVITSESSDLFLFGADYNYYIQDNWTIGFAAGATDGDGPDSYSLALHTDRLWNLGNNKWAGIQAAITRNDQFSYDSEMWTYEIEGRYYFNERTGISISIDIPDGGYSETYSLAFHRYLTPQLSLNLGYDYTKLDLPTSYPTGLDDTNSNFRLKLGYRF